jgi:hypothetical protein
MLPGVNPKGILQSHYRHMDYATLLKNAPDHMSGAFLDYLRANNNLAGVGNAVWLVIENCKYHTEDKPHYTAFLKAPKKLSMNDILLLQNDYPDFDLLIKAPTRQSIKRFHCHLIKK